MGVCDITSKLPRHSSGGWGLSRLQLLCRGGLDASRRWHDEYVLSTHPGSR